MCSKFANDKQPCPSNHYCPEGTMEGHATKCPFWADCPQGTDDICSQDIRGALGSCFIAHGLVFLLISSLLGWVSWRVVGVVQRKGRKSSDQQHELELKERANPASHNRQSGSDDGNLLRRTVSDMVADLDSAAVLGSHMIQTPSLTPVSRLLGAVDFSMPVVGHQGWARLNERLEAGSGRLSEAPERSTRVATSLHQGMLAGSDRDSGDRFSTLQLEESESPRRAPINLRFSEVSLTLKPPLPPVKVLKCVTGELKAGRLTAIMGPSGAGKTSFLNVVSGKAAAYGNVGGQLLINGLEEQEGISKYKRSVGFVPQEDTMLREMSAKEILTFSARMRLPPEVTEKEIQRIVAKTLDDLNLWKIRHSPVGDEERRGISGGQRKRVNIGMELVADPSVLFLDEPTSGLDSTSSLEVCAILRELAAAQNLNVTAVLHQPRYEIFEMFHDVLLLGPGGMTVYLGPAEEAASYFESIDQRFKAPALTNPADFMMDLISGVECGERDRRVPADDRRAEMLSQRWVEHQQRSRAGLNRLVESRLVSQSSEERTQDSPGSSPHERTQHSPRDLPEPEPEPQLGLQPEPEVEPVGERPVQRKARSVCAQGRLFFLRGLMQTVRPPSKLLVDYLLIAIMGLLIGAVFKNTAINKLPASNNFTSMAVGFTTIQSSLRLFGNERVVFWREASSGASRMAYFVGKNLADIPRLLLVPAMYLSLFLGISGVHENNSRRYLALLLAVWATSGLGYVASVLFSKQNAQLGGVSITLICCLLSGFFPTVPESSPFMQTVIACSYARQLNMALWLVDHDTYQDEGGFFARSRGLTAGNWALEPGHLCRDSNDKTQIVIQPCFSTLDFAGTPFGSEEQCGLQGKHECEAKGFRWQDAGGSTLYEIGIALTLIGAAARVIAFALLRYTHRDKQI